MDNIKYIDTPQMKVIFSSLIFRVSSLRRCGWTPQTFLSHTGWSGTTNGHLLMLHDMNMPGYRLLELADDLVNTTGLREWADFVYAEEQLVLGVRGRINPSLGQPIAQLAACLWLGSILTEEGNFVWLQTDAEA